MDSILVSIKKLLGIEESYTHFDEDIRMHINTAFVTLTQIGVGPVEGFSIADKDDKWSDFSEKAPESIKTLMYLKVRLLFDPPTTSFQIEAIKDSIEELEWRIRTDTEFGEGGS